jgi:hypothetical protein
MYYRRKIILSLFQKIGREIGKTEFQKLLFLFTRMQDTPSFDSDAGFIPRSSAAQTEEICYTI